MMLLIALLSFGLQEPVQKKEEPTVQSPVPDLTLPSPPPKEKLSPLEAKMDGTLREISRTSKTGGAPAVKKLTEEKAIPFHEDRVAVKLVARSEKDVAQVKRKLMKLGGKFVSTFENTVYATVKPGSLETLAKEGKILQLIADLPNEQLKSAPAGKVK